MATYVKTDEKGKDAQRKSKRLQGENPEFGNLSTVAKKKMTINGQEWIRQTATVKSDHGDESSASSFIDLESLSSHGNSSWLLKKPSLQPEGLGSVRSAASTISLRRKELETKYKIKNSQQNLEREFERKQFEREQELARKQIELEQELARKDAELEEKMARAELERAKERAELEGELELLKILEEKENSQYLGSDDDEERNFLTMPPKNIEFHSTPKDLEIPLNNLALQSEETDMDPDDAVAEPKVDPPVRAPEWKMQDKVTGVMETRNNFSGMENKKLNYTENKEKEQASEVSHLTAAITNAFNSLALANQNNRPTGTAGMETWMARQTSSQKLTPFYGDPEEWPSFQNEFTEVASRCKWTNGEKMSKLREALKGEARSQVQSLFTVVDNVNKIMETLEMCFGRPDQIIRSLIAKAKNTPSPREDKPDTMIKFSTAVDNLVTTVGTLNKKSHLSNPQLIEELVDKLPPAYKMHWGEFISEQKDEPNLLDFSDKLRKWAKAASFISTPKKLNEDKPKKWDSERKPTSPRPTRVTWKEPVLTTVDSEVKKGKSGCLFCKKSNHELQKCIAFKKEDNNKKWAWVTENKVCFSCLSQGHRVSDCQVKRSCGIDECKSFHHRLLHKKIPPKEEPKEQVEITGNTNVKTDFGKKKVMLKVLPVILRGPKGEISTFALLDDASSVTLVSSKIAKALGAVGPEMPLDIKWIVPGSAKHKSYQVEMSVSDIDRKETFQLHDVRTVENLDLPVQSINTKELSKKWKYLRQAKAATLCNAKPTILIGQNYPDLIVTRDVIEGPPSAPMVSRTKLGWVAHGNNSSILGRIDQEVSFHVFHEDNELSLLHEAVKQTFSTEAFGVKALQNLPKSKDHLRAETIMKSTTRRVGNHFETGLLWKRDDVKFPPSYGYAFNRLRNIEKQMNRRPDFAAQYCKQMSEYIAKGYARKLSLEESKTETDRTWYLPHFGVTNPNKPGKIRMVFDAAAKVNGVSLNDELMKGPDLLSPLVSVLVNFRVKKIGYSADIREMFHQVGIRKEDQDSQRFLWREMDSGRHPDTYEMIVMTFGATCSPSLAQYVKNVNAEENKIEFPNAFKAITERHYVDDFLDSANCEEEAIKLIKDVIEVQRRGGFDLRNWMCSSREVLSQLPEDIICPGGRNLQPKDEMAVERVLGLYWDPNTDDFTFTCNFCKVKKEILLGEKRPTKREVLQLVSSIFDPLGFISHFTVKSRILLQDIWRSGIGWDDEVSNEVFDKWKIWLTELQGINSVRIPRCYSLLLRQPDEVQLHIFADASEEAFSAIAFLRVSKNEEINTSFVMSKCRVAPLRPLSIPRLELQAAVMASRLGVTLQDILDVKIDVVHYWSDSMTVLCWLRSEARNYKPFVAHRLGEIEENSDIANWHWVPTKHNVADDATRADKECDLFPESRWYVGPTFLRLPESEWPKEENNKKPNAEEGHEDLVCVVNNQLVADFNLKYFSSWLRLTRVTAWVRRYLRNRFRKEGEVLILRKWLSVQEIEDAETALVRLSQKESFSDEVKLLKKGKPIPTSSRLYTLSPYLDENWLLRIKGRIERASDLSQCTRNPVILDPKHKTTRLIIHRYHEKAFHSGMEMVANELRQKYHILKMRNAVRAVWRDCQKCRIDKAKPENPRMGLLPSCRVTRQLRPFMETGVDYFGPMEIVVGRHHEKRYGVVFTCMATRAIHLEIAGSLTTDSAVMALRRFIARRGCPRKILSDNGTNFHGADRELKEELSRFENEKIADAMTVAGIEWVFIPPSSPHMGGAWERKVRSVKVALKAILKSRYPKEEVLQTLMAEVENIVNSHPLTRVSDDPNDDECLTPNHFLIGTSSSAPVPGIFVEEDLCLRKQWKIAQCLADMFWKRWMKEFLPTLTCRKKWHANSIPVKVGDLVFIADGNLPRNQWPRGRITDVFPGEDGIVRTVDVQTATGKLRRPVVKICVLDVASESSPAEGILVPLPPRGAPKKSKKSEPESRVGRTRVQPPRGVSLRSKQGANNCHISHEPMENENADAVRFERETEREHWAEKRRTKTEQLEF